MNLQYSLFTQNKQSEKYSGSNQHKIVSKEKLKKTERNRKKEKKKEKDKDEKVINMKKLLYMYISSFM